METLLALIVLVAVIGIPIIAVRIGLTRASHRRAKMPSLDDSAADIAARVKSDPSYIPYR